jgi:hypothetical protein
VRCAAPRMKVGIRERVHELAAGETRAFALGAPASLTSTSNRPGPVGRAT